MSFCSRAEVLACGRFPVNLILGAQCRYRLPILLVAGSLATHTAHCSPYPSGRVQSVNPTPLGTVYLVLLGLAIAIAIGMMGMAWKRRTQRCAPALLVLVSLVALLAAASALEAIVPRIECKEFWVNIQYLGYQLIPIAYLTMVFQYVGFQRWLAPSRILLISAVPLITVILAWTNDYHLLMRRDLFIEPAEGLGFLGKTYGPWFSLASVYSYLITLCGLTLLTWASRRAASVYRRQALLLIIGTVLPLAWSLAYVLRLPLLPPIDFMPPITALSLLLIALAVLRFRLLEIVPVACHQVVQAMEDGLLVLDDERQVAAINPAAARMLSVTPSAAVGEPATQILEAFPQVLAPILAETPPNSIVVSVGTPDRAAYWEVRISELRSERGHPLGQAVILRDVTEQKQGEKARRAIEARMLQAQKLESLGVMAGGIAHDFNNLLQVILSNTDLIRIALPEDHSTQKLLRGIIRSTERAASLASQMLAYSGKGRFTLEQLDPARLVSGMADLLRSLAPKKVALALEISTDIPSIHADAAQIRQLIVSLVSNAAEAIGEREGTITLRLAQVHATRQLLAPLHQSGELPEGNYVQLTITDDGCGMDEATQARVFEPFFTTKFTGRGLGLAAALGIVHAHRGAIGIKSAPGRGTTVTVLIPGAGASPPVQEVGIPLLCERQASGTILVIDDEAGIRDTAMMALRSYGYRVLAASDGLEGIDLFREHQNEIDAVVLDLAMPRMSGEEVVPALRGLRSDVPIILTSGYPEEEALRRFAGRDLSGFLQKPYRPHLLAAQLDTLIARTIRPREAVAHINEGGKPHE
ncbi:MAG TPA: histidine kinase N-terminal 7TM domain-containing protein [Armatimonadota bacterium]|nr:histidine kinase N-terminal 7TM domain-containing protein [Armatimonadota bacterium]